MGRSKSLLLLFLLLLAAGCQNTDSGTPAVDLPTQAAAALLPTETLPPTSTPVGEGLPPTRALTTATPQPTRAITPAPTRTPAPVNAIVNITVPENNAQLLIGQSVNVGGLVQRDTAQTVTVALLTINGQTLLEVEAPVAENSSWQTEFTVPPASSGPAQLQALVRDAAGDILARDVLAVTLVVDTSTLSRYLVVSRPVAGFSAVGGYYLYFDGLAGRPTGNRLTLAILTDNCQVAQATQGIPLNGSGYWQAFVYVPNNISGPGCAMVSFGEPGAEDRWEVSVPIDIKPPEGPDSYGVMIAGPPPGGALFGGQSFVIYGTAYNARDELVQINISLSDGQSIAQATAATDDFGYWETTITVPFGAVGSATLNAFIGQAGDEDYASTELLLEILPAPTPTPGP
jgi:hypothetical protein